MDPEFDRRNAPKENKDEFFDRVPGERPDEREDLSSPRPTRRQAWTRRLVSLVLALVLLAAGFFIGWVVRYYAIDEDVRSFLWALDVTEEYYYPEGFSREKVLSDAGEDATGAELLSALNKNLDPYSQYYSPEEYAAYVRAGEGQNHDYGISFFVGDDSGTIASVSYNSPAYHAGVRQGMRIFSYFVRADATVSGPEIPFTTYAQFAADISAVPGGELVLLLGYETTYNGYGYYYITPKNISGRTASTATAKRAPSLRQTAR